MKQFHKWLKSCLACALLAATLLSPSLAHADAVAKTDKVALQLALMRYIDQRSEDGQFLYFDEKRQSLNGLYPANLHPMIVPVKGFYFLCADFRTDKGEKVDMDFVAKGENGKFKIIQVLMNNRDIVRTMMKAAN